MSEKWKGGSVATEDKRLDATHPESRTEKVIELSKERSDDVYSEVKSAIKKREYWHTKMHEFYKRRYGIRAEKTFPWPNCSNITIPLIDSRIRSLKPVYLNAVFAVSPMVTIEVHAGEDPEKARRVEAFYEWLVYSRMTNTRKKIAHLLDSMVVYGFGVMKAAWRYETERVHRALEIKSLDAELLRVGADRDSVPSEVIEQAAITQLGLNPEYESDRKAIASVVSQWKSGAKIIEVSVQKVTYDAPDWMPIAPWDVVVPWDSPDDVDRLPWITHIVRLTPQEVLDLAESGRYDKEPAKRAADSMSNRTTSQEAMLSVFEQYRVQREGLLGSNVSKPTLVEIWEIYFWHDLNGDGLMERCVMDVAAETGDVLKVRQFPYEHAQWPFAKFNLEETEDRWYAPRGITEMLWDLNEEINATHNMWLDRQTMQNAMSFKYRDGSIKNPSNIRPKPGHGIPVKRMEDFEMLNVQVLDFTYDNQERVLRAWADEYTGNPGLAFNNVVNRVERRTATEVGEISQSSDRIASADVLQFQESMRRLHWQTLRLWTQYGDDYVEIRLDRQKSSIRVSKADLDGRFDLVPSGRLEHSDPRARSQKLLNDIAMASSPMIAPYSNLYEMWRDYMEMSDFRGAARYLRAPGLFEQDAAQQQYAEIIFMQGIRQPAEVRQAEAHDVHVAVLQEALPVWQQRDPELSNLLSAHLFMHMIAAGRIKIDDPALGRLPWTFAQTGDRIQAIPRQTVGSEIANAVGV